MAARAKSHHETSGQLAVILSGDPARGSLAKRASAIARNNLAASASPK
jgi:hypothetical protein